jgi:hypothetical protein
MRAGFLLREPPLLPTQEPHAPPAAYPFRAAILTACAATALLFLRRPIAFLHPQFFAEDGAIFFMQAETNPVAAVVNPYSGYLHVGLRLVALAASPLDPRWIPSVYFAASIAAFLGLELALFSPRLGLPRPWIFALGVVLVPHSGEVFDNLTNAQWITGLGLLLLALARDPGGGAERAFDVGYAAIASLTGVFSIIFAPLFVARAAVRRTSDAFWLAGIVAAGALVQDYEINNSLFQADAGAPGALHVAATFGNRVWLSLLLTPHASDGVAMGMRSAVGAAGLLLLLLLALCGREGRAKRAAMAAALLLLVAAVIYKFRGSLGSLDLVRDGDRYFFIPKVCVIWILAYQVGPASGWRWPARLLLAAVLVNACVGFQFERWENYDWPTWARRIQEEDWVVVPTNPVGFTFTHERHSGSPRP